MIFAEINNTGMAEFIFNPNDPALADTGLFGLPFDAEQSEIVIIPVPWELTTSYNRGTFHGPENVFEGSYQVDLCNHDYPDLWKKGIWLDEFPKELIDLHEALNEKSLILIDEAANEDTGKTEEELQSFRDEIESAFNIMYKWVKDRVSYWKSKGKKVGLLGGDHSIPLSYHQYFHDNNINYGILHVDAHCDLRNSFEGFKYSHASIFYNVMQFDNVKKLVQVGIRDYCHEEKDFVKQSDGRIKVFYDREYRKRLFEGDNWKAICEEIIYELPDNVYVSIDIDGLDPKLCPNTGTPVPGGMDFEEFIYLLNKLKQSGKNIIGFDLCEVANGDNEFNGNVGARVLYQLCGTIN